MLPREKKSRLCLLPSCKGKRFDLVHKFPMDNERAEQWIRILNMPELSGLPIETIRKRFFICSKHFIQKDYKNIESRNLNKTAYPRLFLTENDDAGDAEVVQDAKTSPTPQVTVASQSEPCVEQPQAPPILLKVEGNAKTIILPKNVRILTAAKPPGVTVAQKSGVKADSRPIRLNIVKKPTDNADLQTSPSKVELAATDAMEVDPVAPESTEAVQSADIS